MFSSEKRVIKRNQPWFGIINNMKILYKYGGLMKAPLMFRTKLCGKSLPEQYTGQPKDSGDQTSAHSCCRLSSEKHGEDDISCKCHSTSLLLCSHWSKHPLFGVSSIQGLHHWSIPRMMFHPIHRLIQGAACSLGLYLDLYPMSYREKPNPTLFINSSQIKS